MDSAMALQHVVDTFLASHAGGAVQILALGAGFDTTYFRLKAAHRWPAECLYVELDFPELVQRKAALVDQAEDLASLLAPRWPDAGPPPEALERLLQLLASRDTAKRATDTRVEAAHEVWRDGARLAAVLGHAKLHQDYRLVGADLGDMELAALRLQAVGLRADRPTLVISECVLTYVGPLPAAKVDTAKERAAAGKL
jgi:tRNA wybutosine-synthesizing protein 4